MYEKSNHLCVSESIRDNFVCRWSIQRLFYVSNSTISIVLTFERGNNSVIGTLYRFNSQPHLGLKAIYDLHYRASYELYADVLLVSIHHQCYQYNLQKRECYMIESSLTSQILSCLEIMRQSSQDCITNS